MVSTQQPHSFSQHVPQNGTNYMYVNDLQQVPPVQSNSMMNPPMMGLVGEGEGLDCSTASPERRRMTPVCILIVSFEVFVLEGSIIRAAPKRIALFKPVELLHVLGFTGEQSNGC